MKKYYVDYLNGLKDYLWKLKGGKAKDIGNKIKCLIGFHSWHEWEVIDNDPYDIYMCRCCKNCSKTQTKEYWSN